MSATPVMMNKEMMVYLLEELSYETIVDEADDFPYRIQKKKFGYLKGIGGVIQAALSVSLEMRKRREEETGR